MCNKFISPPTRASISEFHGAEWRELELDDEIAARAWKQNFNTAPMHTIAYIVQEGTKRYIDRHKWGFPHPKLPKPVVNARCENVYRYPMFSGAFFERRCIIPLQGFVEYPEESVEPYYFWHESEPQIVVAGIWDYATDKAGKRERRVCMVTTLPTKPAISIGHTRSPVILSSQDVATWLNPASTLPDLKTLMVPNDREPIKVRRVTIRINYKDFNGEELLGPVDAEKDAEFLAMKAAEKKAKDKARREAKKLEQSKGA